MKKDFYKTASPLCPKCSKRNCDCFPVEKKGKGEENKARRKRYCRNCDRLLDNDNNDDFCHNSHCEFQGESFREWGDEKCICNHANPETDCFPKIRCACKVHKKHKTEWEIEFENNFKDWKIHHKSIPCIQDTFVIGEIKSFINSLLHQAEIKSAIECAEHEKIARVDERNRLRGEVEKMKKEFLPQGMEKHQFTSDIMKDAYNHALSDILRLLSDKE